MTPVSLKFIVCIALAASLVGCGKGKVSTPPGTNGTQSRVEGDNCLTSNGCDSPFFCEADGCFEGAQGICSTIPSDCSSKPVSQVCGCDGNTYNNRCEAHRHHINVAIDVPCGAVTTGGTTGGSTPTTM